MKLLQFESYKKGIVLSTVFNILNKGLVFVSSLVVAYFFGAQLKMDVYFYAYSVILIISTFITSLNASVLIPESISLRTQERSLEAMKFLNFFIYLYLLITFLIWLLFVLQPVRAFTLLSDFEIESLQRHATILTAVTPLILLMPIVNLLTDILTSYRFFSISMFAGIVNGIFSILFVVIFHAKLDILSLLLGLLFSYAINLLLLLYLLKKRLHWNFGFQWVKVDRKIWRNIVFAQAGNITSSFTVYAPLYLLSGFSAGIITSLNFANQIAFLPTNLVTNQFSAITGIKFNELYAQRNLERLNEIFLTTASFLIFLLTPVSGIFLLFSNEIVSVLFQRGAFGENGVSFTAQFLQFLGLLLPMYVINTLFSRLFMATHKIMESFWYQIAFNVFLILSLYFAIRQFGFIAYPVTMACVHLVNIFFCHFLEKRYFNFINYGRVLKDFGIIVLTNMVIATVVYYSMHLVQVESKIISLVFGCFLYCLLIALAGIFFNLDKTFKYYLGLIWQRKKKYGRS